MVACYFRRCAFRRNIPSYYSVSRPNFAIAYGRKDRTLALTYNPNVNAKQWALPRLGMRPLRNGGMHRFYRAACNADAV